MNPAAPPPATCATSVLIPACNAAATIASTLASVLAQVPPPDEVIVIDDGSSDGTDAAVAQVPGPVRCLRQSNQGPAAARNLGLAHCRGQLVFFQDADDLWEPDKLRCQVAAFARDPQLGMVFTNIVNQASDGTLAPEPLLTPAACESLRREATSRSEDTFFLGEGFLPRLLLGLTVGTPTVAVRREVLLELGGFDAQWRVGEDVELWLRLAARYRCAYVDRVLCRRRLHAANLTRDRLALDLAELRLLPPWLAAPVPWRPGQRHEFRRRLARLAASLGRRFLREGRGPEGRACLRRALGWDFQARTAAWYGLGLLPPALRAPLLRRTSHYPPEIG